MKPFERIYAPFTDEQVEKLNRFQSTKSIHPFTCCTPSEIRECQRRLRRNEGILIATNDGWVCPCGEYVQDWAYAGMLDDFSNI
jgi:hypothetical protein